MQMQHALILLAATIVLVILATLVMASHVMVCSDDMQAHRNKNELVNAFVCVSLQTLMSVLLRYIHVILMPSAQTVLVASHALV